MRDTKGFTLVEAMIGMVILAFIVTGALSFFILWSSRSTESFRYKNADEAAATAVGLLTTDIRKAGFGLVSSPALAVFVVDNGTANADELYLSYGDYLNLEGDIRAPATDTGEVPYATVSVAYRSINSVFKQSREFTASGIALSYQGRITLDTTSNFTLRAVPTFFDATHFPNIGAVISADPAAVDVNINGTSQVTGQIPGTQDWTFPLVNTGKDDTGTSVTLSVGTAVTPAISYKWVASTDPAIGGALWRNRGSDAAPFGAPIMGGSTSVDVTNFQVRCQFADASWDTTNSQPATLRVVEAIITYRIKIGQTYKVDSSTQILGWGTGVQRRLIVSPRSIAMADQM